jgi:hypothetical protein
MPVCVRTRTGRHHAHRRKLGNNMARAQFLSACGHAQAGIVPLQHNYNQKIIIYYKIIYNAPYIKSVENIFGFLGNNHKLII